MTHTTAELAHKVEHLFGVALPLLVHRLLHSLLYLLRLWVASRFLLLLVVAVQGFKLLYA